LLVKLIIYPLHLHASSLSLFPFPFIFISSHPFRIFRNYFEGFPWPTWGVGGAQVPRRVELFGIIHLPNTDLTYIRNPKRNKIMFVSFHLLKTYIRNPSLLFISFLTPHPEGIADGNNFAMFLFLPSWLVKLLEANFSCFAKIRWMSCWFAKLSELALF
jgi:hypothetical protein